MPRVADGYAKHPVVRYVRSLPGNYYLRTEAAEALGCAPSVLSYLAVKHPDLPLGPTHRANYGNVELLLYTPERVEEIRVFMKKNKVGPRNRHNVRMFTPAELQQRRRTRGRAYSYRSRAKDYDVEGRTEDAALLRKAADDVDVELAKEKAKRVTEMARKSGTKH